MKSMWTALPAAMLATTFAGISLVGGCSADSTDTGDDEGESTDSVESALDAHDGRPGSGGPINTNGDCMNRCRQVLSMCIDGCKSYPPDTQPECIASCNSVYAECARNCGWERGGCNSLDSADCNPWWDWSTP